MIHAHLLSSSLPAGASIHYWQAIILGIIQGVTELFPVSSIGHTVVLPALFGWTNVVKAQSASESFWLAFVVGLHVGTAVALLIFYRREWGEIIRGFFHSVQKREIRTPNERLAWLLIVATIPAGITGLALEHALRVLFAKPLAASIFLVVNGLILAFGDVIRRRAEVSTQRSQRRAVRAQRAAAVSAARGSEDPMPVLQEDSRHLETLELKEGVAIGTAQVFALIAGISRSGITIVAGLTRRLDYSDAARFSFLLATPVILLAGLYKLPDFLGSLGAGLRGQAIVASVAAGIAAWFSVRFLAKYFTSHTLWPFALYCIVFGSVLVIHFS